MISDKLYKSISIIGAFLIWSLWTYYINPGATHSRLISAVCQGLISATATYLMINSLKYLQQKISNFLYPSLIVTAVTTSVGVVIHILIGTPEIFSTLAPACTVALIFSLITSYNLKIAANKESKSCLKNSTEEN